MGDAVITLIAVLVGAAASLAGSVIVNRLELRRRMRFRLYDEMIPGVQNPIRLLSDYGPDADADYIRERIEEDLTDKMVAIHRVGGILSRGERGRVVQAQEQWSEALIAAMRKDDLDVIFSKARETSHQLAELSDFLRKKLD